LNTNLYHKTFTSETMPFNVCTRRDDLRQNTTGFKPRLGHLTPKVRAGPSGKRKSTKKSVLQKEIVRAPARLTFIRIERRNPTDFWLAVPRSKTP